MSPAPAPATASTRYSATYAEARDRFRAATSHVPHGALTVTEDLTIDWAYTGDVGAPGVLVYSSGLHGVEGYAGSAAQLELLAAGSPVPTLWLHALNPWGMANLRRFNERNVDLNRNFLPPDQPYARVDPMYARVDPLLNPPTPPGFELFWPRVGLVVLQHGFQTLKNAVVGGQYQNPKGLFWGGDRLEAGPAVLLPFVEEWLGRRRKVVHIDLHTGLGAWGARTLLLEGVGSAEQTARVRGALGPDVRAWDAANPDAYEIRGGMLSEIQRRLPGVRYDAMTCEFGSVANLRILAALRAENRHFHHGGGAIDHPSKRALLEAFVPADAAWRAGVLAHAHAVAEGAARLLAV